jgi:hypothetical protein
VKPARYAHNTIFRPGFDDPSQSTHIDSTRASGWELFDTETRQSLRKTVIYTVIQESQASVDNVNAQLGLGTRIGAVVTGELHPCMFRHRSSAPMCSPGHVSPRVTNPACRPVGADTLLRVFRAWRPPPRSSEGATSGVCCIVLW